MIPKPTGVYIPEAQRQAPAENHHTQKLVSQVLSIFKSYEFKAINDQTVHDLQDEINHLLRQYAILREVPTVNGIGVRNIEVKKQDTELLGGIRRYYIEIVAYYSRGGSITMLSSN